MEMKAYTVCARAQASIFMVSWPWPFSKKNCPIVKEVWTMTEQVVKSKDLRRQTKEWIANFSQTVWEMFNRKSCKYMCNNFTKQKGKKFKLHNIDQSFGHNGMGISYQKKLESLEEKKVVHTSCKHGVRRICQLYTKGGPAGKLMWCEPLETIWIIVDETTYKDPAPKTLDELRQWLRFAWKNVTLDTPWELVHSIPHRLENVRKHTGRHSGY